jgi:hypothetical protein
MARFMAHCVKLSFWAISSVGEQPDSSEEHDFREFACIAGSAPQRSGPAEMPFFDGDRPASTRFRTADNVKTRDHLRDERRHFKKALAPFYKHLFAAKLWAYYPRR